jgi:SAM-dependent methyltransferase
MQDDKGTRDAGSTLQAIEQVGVVPDFDQGLCPSTFWSTASLATISSTLRPHPMLWDLLRPEHHIVDLGCGFGELVRHLHFTGFSRAVGLDINPRVIEQAILQSPIHEHAFAVGDARRTGLATGSCDIVIAQALLTVLAERPDRLAALQETRRILAPDGTLYLADFAQAWHSPVYAERYRRGVEMYGEIGTFDAPGPSAGDGTYVAHHFSERELIELLEAATLRVQCFRYRRVTTRSGNRIYGMCIIASPDEL